MHHSTTLHEIARIERAEALRRAERVAAVNAETAEDEPVGRVTLRTRVAERLGGAARARAASLPESPAA